MPVFEKFKNLWKGKSGDLQTSRKSVAYSVIQRDSDPEAVWDIIKELGDGAFGKVQLVIQLFHFLNLLPHCSNFLCIYIYAT